MRKGFLLSLVVCGSIASVFAQKFQYKTWNALDSNHGNDIGFQSIMPAAKKARVFFLGENHSQNIFNTRMEYTMMRALNENCGYKNLIIELSPTTAYFMERYICYNDTLARKALNVNSASYYMTYFDYMHRWQQSLPMEKRIKIHGIDVERFEELPKFRLSALIEKHRNNIPKKLVFNALELIKQGQDFIQGSQQYGYDDYANPNVSIENVQQKVFNDANLDSLYKYKSLLPEWLGAEDYATVNELFNIIYDCIVWNGLEGSPQQYLWREDRMYRNLKTLLQNNPLEKYFGQFGRCHTAYNPREGDCGWYNYSSTAKKLTQGYFNHDESKVLTIGIFYRTVENQNSYNDAENDDEKEQLEKEVNRLVGVASKNVLVVDLKDSLQNFTQLSKKFHFAFVSSKSYKELEPIDSLIRAIDVTAVELDERNQLDIGLLGFGINQWLGSGLTHNINLSQAKSDIKSINSWNYQFYLHNNINHFTHGLQIQYQPGKTISSDDFGNYTYSNYGLSYALGMNFNISKIKVKLLGELGWVKQSLDYESTNVDLTKPTAQLNRTVVNHMMMSGAIMRVDYMVSERNRFGLSVKYGMALTQEIWNYANSDIQYANFGKGLGLVSVGLSYARSLSF